MFPIRDENPTLHASIATFLIIGANIAVWIFVQGLGMAPRLIQSVCEYGAIAGELLGRVEPGTRVPIGDDLVYILDGTPKWATVITCMFMHGGWMHLIGNMWFLAVFGDNVEDAMGTVRFLVFYLLCGVAAVAAQVVSDPTSTVPMVGASGAIGGVMGAYAVLFPRARVHMLVFLGFLITRIVVPAFLMLGYWFLLQLVSGMIEPGGSGVAFWAHIGGFVAGLVLVPIFCNRKRLAQCRDRRGPIHRR